MGDLFRQALQFARYALKLETATTAGRINALGLVFATALVGASAAIDLLQALVRICKPGYTAGLPSTMGLFALFLAGTVLCVAVLARADFRGGQKR